MGAHVHHPSRGLRLRFGDIVKHLPDLLQVATSHRSQRPKLLKLSRRLDHDGLSWDERGLSYLLTNEEERHGASLSVGSDRTHGARK